MNATHRPTSNDVVLHCIHSNTFIIVRFLDQCPHKCKVYDKKGDHSEDREGDEDIELRVSAEQAAVGEPLYATHRLPKLERGEGRFRVCRE